VTAAERGPGKSTMAGTNGRLVWRFVDTVGDFAWAASNQFVWDASRATIPTRGPIPFNILICRATPRRTPKDRTSCVTPWSFTRSSGFLTRFRN
jgi:hypothetical protein